MQIGAAKSICYPFRDRLLITGQIGEVSMWERSVTSTKGDMEKILPMLKGEYKKVCWFSMQGT